MLFRTPTDDPKDNLSFYENEYTQGFTTEVPSEAELVQFRNANFIGSPRDYSYYISTLNQLGLKSGAKIFDYGCSWGYGSYQLINAGFEVVSFEISPTRRRFARENLGIVTADDIESVATELANTFDCFFSAHVLEHVPSPSHSFGYAMRLLKTDGVFVSFTPNGSDGYRAKSSIWSKAWGEVHPTFIDVVFLDNSFRRSPRVVGSSPVNNASFPDQSELKRLDKVDRAELFFAARKVGNYWG